MRLSRESGFNFHFFAEAGFCSILTSILESFWRPRWPLYSFLAALEAKKGSPKSGQKKKRQIQGFRVGPADCAGPVGDIGGHISLQISRKYVKGPTRQLPCKQGAADLIEGPLAGGAPPPPILEFCG